MAKNIFGLVHTLLDDSGALEPGGTIEVYRAGTSTQQTVYSDRALTTTAGYQITADAAGRLPERWIADSVIVKLLYKDSSGATLATRDFANDDSTSINGYYVDFYGALGDGTTDDTTAIQAAYTACRTAGGGQVHFTPAKTYIISQSIVMGSNTVTHLNGCTVKAKTAGWVGTVANNNYQMFRNYNFTAASLTDSDIYMVGPGTVDFNSIVISGGGAHCFSCRYVDRAGVDGVNFKSGENATAFLACRDVFTTNCVANNMNNCHFDHWDGSGKAVVYNCRAENEAAFTGAQGVQFTGTGTASEDRTSTDFVVEATTVKGVRGGAGASGIISNAADADSATYSFRSSMNIIEDCDLGLVFSGEGGRHFSSNDTLKGVTKVPILIQTANSDSPDDCQVHNPLLIDCDDDGNVALMQISGTGHVIKGAKLVNTGAALYTKIVYFAGDASNCLVEIIDGADGTTSRVQNDGTNCRVIDRFRRYEEGTYTPTLSFVGGSTGITYNTQEGRYTRVGDLVFVTGYIILTSKGSSTGAARISVPIGGAATTQPGGGSCPYAANFGTLTSGISLGMNTGATVLVMRDHGAAGSADVDDTNFANSSAFTFEATYKAVS